MPDEVTMNARNSLTQRWLCEHHFTDMAIRCFRDARVLAQGRGIYGKLPPVLILWAMLRGERTVGAVVLENCDVDLARLATDVETELKSCPAVSRDDGIDHIHLRSVADNAVEEAAQFGEQCVWSGHLVGALCRCDDQIARRLLHKNGVTIENYRQSLHQILSGKLRAQ
jgi:ATP-dependent Clp protease ATP-binding subunit ClpA